MPVVRCRALHTYNTDFYDECPLCAKFSEHIERRKIELENRQLDEVFRGNGYFANSEKLYLDKNEVKRNAAVWGRPEVKFRDGSKDTSTVFETIALVLILMFTFGYSILFK